MDIRQKSEKDEIFRDKRQESEKDEILMLRVIQNDPHAADSLVIRYQDVLFSFLYRMTLNQADAEDIFQETWMRVIRYRQTFDPGKKFSTWLFQIAVNCARDFFGKKTPMVEVEEDIPVDHKLEFQDVENKEAVESIVRNLPLYQREVLVLRYFHDMKEKDIADLLDIPLGTVKSRLHKALEYLKKYYGEMEDDGKMDE